MKGPKPLRIAAVAFSPDGRQLATAGSGEYPGIGGRGEGKGWDAQTGVEGRPFAELRTSANAVAFSPDGKYLAASTWGESSEAPWPGEVLVWDAVSGKRLHTFGVYELNEVHPGQVMYLVTGL